MARMLIGKIVKSNSHIDYICQVYGPGEIQTPPSPEDFGFATFVKVAFQTQPSSFMIGIIYNTMLLNPDFGRLGPRLSPQADLAVFSPDYLNEKVTLVGILAIGTLTPNDESQQGVPRLVALTDAMVERLTDDEMLSFHGRTGLPRLAYYPLILSQGWGLAPYIIKAVLEKLRTLYAEPSQVAVLDLLADNLNWQTQVTSLGGGR
jgi:hypothetical protein